MVISSPRAGNQGLQPAPEWWPHDLREWNRKIASVANAAFQGDLDAIGSVTLTASTTTSTLTDDRIGTTSTILFMPTTANAALELTGMLHIDTVGLYVSARAEGSATLTHSNDSSVDRTYGYLIIG